MEMNEPLVSIITPCYNGEQFVDRYFRSILAQTYSNLELIFVNDGSTDKTEEIALSYREALEKKGVKYIYLYQENAGQAAALNRGLKLFTGEYLTWPDSDDEMMPECIEKKVRYMEDNPTCDLSICKVACVKESNPEKTVSILERKQFGREDNLFEDLLFLRNVFFVPGGYMVRSSTVEEVLNERDIYSGLGGQNAQVLVPVAWKGQIGYLEEILYKYYIRKESHSHSIQSIEATIRQLEYFEIILVETLKRMEDKQAQKYIPMVQNHYATLRFGNAVDSKESTRIKKYFKQMKLVKKFSIKEWMLYIKYTNKILRKMLKVDL